MSSNKLFGWELLFNNLKSDIKKKEDLLLIAIHYTLIKTGFKCVGVNDDWKSEENEISSELLPKEWNADKEYVFRYKYDTEKYMLRSSHTDDSTIIFNFMQTQKLKVSNVIFNYDESVQKLEGSIEEMIPTYQEILETVQRDLIAPFVSNPKKHSETQTTENQTPTANVTVPFADFAPQRQRFVDIDDNPEFDFRSIGRRDLDPLGGMGMGGGSLFEFENRRRRRLDQGPGIPEPLPSLARPPGARFDPFGPPDRNLRPGPNRFPPEYDDMFS